MEQDKRDKWPRATLGSVARGGDPITIWCNNYACGYRLAQRRQYRAVLSVADLEALAERYGDDLPFIEFRARLRWRHCRSGDVSTIIGSTHPTPQERWEREKP